MGWDACLNKQWSIRRQWLITFLSVTVAILIVLVLAVVLLTDSFIGKCTQPVLNVGWLYP